MDILEIIFKVQNYILIKLGIGEVVFIRKRNVKCDCNFVKQATINGC